MTEQKLTATGTLTVYCGPMYAGKTSLLIAELEESLDCGETVLVIKPTIDNRYKEDDVVSHDGISLKKNTSHPVLCLPVDGTVTEEQLQGVTLVLIDEAQFFEDLSLVQVPDLLVAGVNVIAFGLDMDSEGRPFGSMPRLLTMADRVVKMKSECVVCGEDAQRTFRKLSAKSTSQVLIGGAETYEARCHKHWLEGLSERKRWMA